MKTIKSIQAVKIMFLVIIMLSTTLWSQASYNDGYKAFYNRNYQVAADILENIVNEDPNNEYANYYLGQTFIKLKTLSKASDVYTSASQNPKFSRSGLIIAGQGHLTLIQGDSIEARVAFDEAINISRSKNADVFYAVGYANLEKKGNIDYGIDVLLKATETKRFSNAKVYTTLGYLYKKKRDGSKAVQAFNNAIRMNPTEAEAFYQIGKVFATQNNEEIYLLNYRKAIKADPSFAPTYFELYSHYFDKTQTDSARKYLTLYEQNLSKQVGSESLIALFNAELLFLEKKYNESIEKASAIKFDNTSDIGKVVELRVLRLQALCYNAKKDYNQAHDLCKNYIHKLDMSDNDVAFSDMFLYVKLLSQADSNLRAQYFEPAVRKTLAIKKDDIKIVNRIADKLADICSQVKYPQGSAKIKIIKLSMFNNQAKDKDYFNAGYAAVGANLFQAADSILRIYITKKPEEPYGYFWLASANAKIDPSLETAKPFFEKYLSLTKDKVQENKTGVTRAKMIIATYHTRKKQYEKAIKEWSDVLAIDPNNATAKKVKSQLITYQEKIEDYKKRKAEHERIRKEYSE